jgi:hypothetical protein
VSFLHLDGSCEAKPIILREDSPRWQDMPTINLGTHNIHEQLNKISIHISSAQKKTKFVIGRGQIFAVLQIQEFV